MHKLIRTSLSLIILSILSACSFPGVPTEAVFANSVLKLAVATQNNVTTFSKAGDVINYNYVVTNSGSSPLAGPVIVTDGTKQVICPEVKTVGNGDIYLDFNETVTCTSAYAITDADVNTGSVTNLATARAGDTTSNPSGLTLTRGAPAAASVLTLSKSANPQTYSQVGQTISYNFTITNIGTTPIGPAQFVINDNKLGPSLACGPADTTIAPNQSLPCTINYGITQADLAVTSITNSATASGAGQTTAPASATITNANGPATQTPPVILTATVSPNLAPGSTIQHQVAVGEWLIQIGRCYGATFSELRNANPQIANPNFILPSMVVTVPRIGSAGKIYGPPCITFYTVQSGDTWTSLAQKFNADVAVMQRVNPGGLVVGKPAKIPLNSAGGSGVVVTAIPVTTTAPQVPAPTGQRISFPAGQNTASLVGVVNPNQTLQYIVTAAPGQMLTITMTSDPNVVSLGVTGPTGIALKSPDGNLNWNAMITTGGDHYINIISRAGSSSTPYTLNVTLTASTTPNTPVP